MERIIMPKRIIYEITITDESVLDLIRHDDRVLKIRRPTVHYTNGVWNEERGTLSEVARMVEEAFKT
jgi:hypothetical protein